MSVYVREETIEYNYDFQCWVKEGVIQRCGHVEHCECLGRQYAGLSIVQLYRKVSKLPGIQVAHG